MPPGNSSNKPAVVERCSYCRNPSCSGERNHIVRSISPISYTRGYSPPPTVIRDSDLLRQGNISPGELPNRTTFTSVRTTPAASKPSFSPENQFLGSSGNVLPNKTGSSLVRRDISTESAGPSTAAPLNSRLSSTGGSASLDKTDGSTNASTANTKPAEIVSSQSSITSSIVKSNESVGYSTPRSSIIHAKPPAPTPPAPKPAVVLGNQSSSTTCSVESKKTICYTTSFNTDAKPSALKPAVSTKPLTSLGPSSRNSGFTVSISSNDVSNLSFAEGLTRSNKIADLNKDSDSSYSIAKVDLEGWIDRSKGECLQSSGNDVDLENPLEKHSKRAGMFEGVVTKISGSRTAEVTITDLFRDVKLAQLLVEKLSVHRNAPAYASSVDIKSVLRVGETITVVCTEHKRKESGFHYFVHQAWKTKDDSTLNNNWVNNDTESVNSFASHGSLHDSEKQKGKAASRRGRRRKKEIGELASNDLGVDVSQWLNNSSQLNSIATQSAAIVEGCEYFGKVVKLRLPFAFLVEIELNKGSQYIFVYSKYFYPEGPNSSSMAQGLSIKGIVSVGDGMIVIPIRSNQQKSADYEWVARKAWPKGKESLSFEVNQNISEKVPPNYVELFHSKNSDFSRLNSDQDGAILSLQTDWGLVREVSLREKKNGVFVFSRKNAYLFGLSLKNFVLEDVFREGDAVKFSLEEGARGEMNANLLYYGYKMPDFNSFIKAIHNYCEQKNIKHSVETDLGMLGEEMYSFK